MTEFNCEMTRERFGAMMDGAGSESGDQARRHLDGCAACQKQWARYRLVVGCLRALPEPVLARDLSVSVNARIDAARFKSPLRRWRLAFAATVATAALAWFMVRLQPAELPRPSAEVTLAMGTGPAKAEIRNGLHTLRRRAQHDRQVALRETLGKLYTRKTGKVKHLIPYKPNGFELDDGAADALREMVAAGNPGTSIIRLSAGGETAATDPLKTALELATVRRMLADAGVKHFEYDAAADENGVEDGVQVEVVEPRQP